MSPFLACVLWFIGFLLVTRTISIVGGKFSRYIKSTFNQDLLISMILSVLVVFVL